MRFEHLRARHWMSTCTRVRRGVATRREYCNKASWTSWFFTHAMELGEKRPVVADGRDVRLAPPQPFTCQAALFARAIEAEGVAQAQAAAFAAHVDGRPILALEAIVEGDLRVRADRTACMAREHSEVGVVLVDAVGLARVVEPTERRK